VGLINIFGGFRTPAMTREQVMGRVLLGVFEVGLGVLLIIIDAASTRKQTACWGLGVYWRDSTHPAGFPDAHSKQGETCWLNEQVLTENDTFSLSCGELLSPMFSSSAFITLKERIPYDERTNA
jgi:hypothetical protein